MNENHIQPPIPRATCGDVGKLRHWRRNPWWRVAMPDMGDTKYTQWLLQNKWREVV
jgi:hypothetical protein